MTVSMVSGLATVGEAEVNSGELKVFTHMLYEIEKGIRPLALHTVAESCVAVAIAKLASRQMAWFLQPVPGSKRFNLFFGETPCITLMKQLLRGRTLTDLSPEEDFMLGALLGYDLTRQCVRFIDRKTQS